ncbi:MAG TPA: CehA/McbA family metallohydrolase [Chitinophagaceae bacterium]|nr:CehA/McbA family metallohydrolase [Chitinophagaceae bacterium]
MKYFFSPFLLKNLRHVNRVALFLLLFSIFSKIIFAQEKQPFYFHVKKIIEILDYTGNPISKQDKDALADLINKNAEISLIKEILDHYCLFKVEINPESRVKVNSGMAKPELHQSGWKTFLVEVTNQAGITAKLEVESEQAKRTYDGGEKIYGLAYAGKGSTVTQQQIRDRWLDISLYTQNSMLSTLSGLETEYFIIQLYSRDAGKRAASIAFHCGQGTQDIGLRNKADILFNCLPAQKIRLEILDENKKPTTASLIIKDEQGHVYPSQMKRLAPDFFFQSQIYRTHNETIDLPIGKYTIQYNRGPEYLTKTETIKVTNLPNQIFKINLERWIDPNQFGWYSGDHHIHAAGCSHYTSPSQGVNPEDMMRHILGEGVNVGSVLTWGPGYYHQKQFFEGTDNKLSTKTNLLRYDLEISGFPSSHAGHLVLLRLKEQDYPNTKVLEDWPTYTIPILKWAKAQGAITGYAHTGLGLEVKNDALPNYEMPNFDGIGANEYIVAVTQNLIDFISTMDTPPTWELNIWYHTLNCGFRTRISGETDFPCMSDDKVAHGRSYVKIDKPLNFYDWAEGLKSGRTYVSEGKSHIMDFKVNNTEVGTNNSEVNLASAAKVRITAKVAALLEKEIDTTIHPLNISENIWTQKPFWNIERGRIGKTRTIAVELIINGEVAAVKDMKADGSIQNIFFEAEITKSSWVALRILPSSHSNPIFVVIDNKPIRSNKKSVEWCLKAVDVCWKQKQGKIAEKEKASAKKDYENAIEVYRKILEEFQK